jgi:hypothetical protein
MNFTTFQICRNLFFKPVFRYKMEELQLYFEEKLHIIKQNRELVTGDPEETQAILLELNSVCLTMKTQLAQHRQEVHDWRQQIASAKR